MKEPNLVEPLFISDDPLFTVKLYNPEFEEFVVYYVEASTSGKPISLSGWSIAIVIEGTATLTKEDNGEKVEMLKYSVWLLEPGEYIVGIDENVAEICIASEKPITSNSSAINA